MKTIYRLLIFCFISLSITAAPCIADDLLLSSPATITEGIDIRTGQVLYAENEEGMESAVGEEEEEDLDYLMEDEELDEIADPFEPINRVFFHFNDKLYFWVLKPVAQGYSWIVPEPGRVGVKNFFNNIATPIRFVNNVLQLKLKPAGNEIIRFGANSTLGLLGLFDFAKDNWDIRMQEEDLGQTFGVWGAGPGFYINWPILGPSSLRDTIGDVGDAFLDPVSYVTPTLDRIAIKAGDTINRASLRIGDYERIKEEAIDPYAAFRDIYYQYRKSKIDR